MKKRRAVASPPHLHLAIRSEWLSVVIDKDLVEASELGGWVLAAHVALECSQISRLAGVDRIALARWAAGEMSDQLLLV
jgi:hypothetical protein